MEEWSRLEPLLNVVERVGLYTTVATVLAVIAAQIEPFFKSLETSGGYAIILAMVVAGLFYIARRWVDGMAARAAAREAEAKQDFAAQLERERMTQEGYREMARQSNDALARVAEVMGETNATLRQTTHAFERNTEAFERNSEAFNRWMHRFSANENWTEPP